MLAAVGSFSRELIVRAAEDADVGRFRAAAFSVWLAMIELEPSSGAAALAAIAYPRAGEPIAFQHGSAGGAAHMARGWS